MSDNLMKTLSHTMSYPQRGAHAMLRFFSLSLLTLIGAGLLSCGEIKPTTPTESTANEEVQKLDGDCEPGVLGCRCLRGDFECWDEDAICIGGICREQTCDVGDENCACFANSTCSQNADGSWLVCGVNGICRQPACPQGDEGCGCFAGFQCNEGLFCQDDGQTPPVCVRPNCPAGDLNCGCFPDRSCGVDSTGTQLVCEGSTCTRPQCNQGTQGCACRPDYSCDGNLLCDGGTCEPPSCVQGSLSCACEPDGSCNSGLRCDANGTCQAINCPQGEEGCGCFPDFTCGSTADQAQLLCSATGRCVRTDCRAGVRGCGCAADGSCETGFICANGFCEEEAPRDPNFVPREPPILDLCLTSCKEDYEAPDGQFYPCNSDHLMQTCLPKKVNGQWVDRLCDRGSCVLEGIESPLACATDLDCPDYQLCFDGLCASNCETDTDCAGGRQCAKNVCRMPCRTDASTCSDDEFCASKDAESGFCMAKVPVEADAPVASAVLDRFSVDINQIKFTNTRTSFDVIITNHSPRSISIPVKRLRHERILEASGNIEVNESREVTLRNADGSPNELDPQDGARPLNWLEFTARDASLFEVIDEADERAQLDDSLVIVNLPSADETTADASSGLKPNQVRLTVSLDNSNAPVKRWNGDIVIGDENYGKEFVGLNYSVEPDGQWRGQVTYVSDFGVNDQPVGNNPLLTWMSDKIQSTEETDSVFLEKWHTLIRSSYINGFQLPSRLKEREFDAVLGSINNKSWKQATDDAGCNDPFCFWYDRCPEAAEGLPCTLSNNNDGMMPRGLLQYPIAMNLKKDGDNYVGRIETTSTLHYSATPQIALSFERDSTDCSGSECFNPLLSLDTTIVAGGRFVADPVVDAEGTLESPVSCPEGYEPFDIPWLVRGFRVQTAYDEEDAARKRYECRSSQFPYPIDGSVSTINGEEVGVELLKELNLRFASTNPIPDGKSRVRRFELIDGGLINEERLFIIFRERFENFVPGQPDFFAYGYMDLRQEPAELEDSNYEGIPHVDPNDSKQVDLYPTCSEELQAEIERMTDGLSFEAYLNTSAENVANVVSVLINGVASAPNGLPFASTNPAAATAIKTAMKRVHYICHDTGTIDGCGDADELLTDSNGDPILDANGNRQYVPGSLGCPEGSGYTYFVLGETNPDTGVVSVDRGYEFKGRQICDLPCNSNGSCGEFLGLSEAISSESVGSGLAPGATWLANHSDSDKLLVPASTCFTTRGDYIPGDGQTESVRRVNCDTNRADLRQGREFYIPNETDSPRLSDLYSDIEEAFRYKTRFRNRDGTNLGFTPEMCDPSDDSIRYCYAPRMIEQIRERINCLQWINNGGAARQTASADQYLDDLEFLRNNGTGGIESTFRDYTEFMKFNFGANYFLNAQDDLVRYDGFEKLYAELLIMLGDEAYTDAFRSRFDLAGVRGAPFLGHKFERNGIRLEGTAGFEMYSLYRAVQYYDYALEQFYMQAETIGKLIADDSTFNRNERERVIDIRTVVEYFNTLIRASSQKTRAWSAVAERYQSFNRADLARDVLQRGYASAYSESVMFSRFMLSIVDDLDITERPQLYKVIEDTNRRYTSGLRKMRETFATLTDEPLVFGLDPLYIPFPALEPQESNAFEKIMTTVRRKLADAAQKEDRALNEDRAFETDAAMFQQELTKLRNTYESQLGDICGTFEAEGRIYPAIQRYAHLDERLKYISDPCGLVGNGQIYQGLTSLETLNLSFEELKRDFENQLLNINDMKDKASAKCEQILERADFEVDVRNQTINLERKIRGARQTINDANQVWEFVQKVASLQKCNLIVGLSNGGDCLTAPIATATLIGGRIARELVVRNAEKQIEDRTRAIEDLETQATRTRILKECDSVMLDTEFNVKSAIIGLNTHELKSLSLQYQLRAKLAEINSLRNKAKSLEAEQEEAEQMAINVQAARNDPNVRIYRNDAVLNADRTFKSALTDIYKATRIFEYYSSQSYAPLNDLFLVRMVSRGDISLEAYVDELEDAFNAFEEDFGIPDLRVDVISLRDFVMDIPTEDTTGQPLSQSERVKMFRERLTDNSLLDKNGYRVMPFSLSESRLSPLTRNHKIAYMEAEFVGSRVGDSLGRLYLRNGGTSVVRPLDGANQYYRFPKHVAVINTFFNGQKVFPANLYQNQRLRDRPFLNSRWELILNQSDELANQDIDLNSLTDIKVYVYYRDFTDF